MVNRFIGSSLVVTTISSYTLKITVTIAHVTSHTKFSNSSGHSVVPLELRNSSEVNSESESYVTTDGQSASLSWYKAPIRGLRPDFYFCTEYGIRLTATFLIPWGALSDERTGLSFVCAAGPCQRSLFRS
jgi:hypothetical protein